ncbi:MAG: hypothetical protein ASUL_03374 [Candidatus Aramenus sulfurataquae]|jgi:hypothetical protein|uniref:Uncharacterized protein n=2 Tax=Candidatus Aramenus sulfurataquae TaxID=1326980 RepID=W7KJH4_9CREN|nr:MAG: hypothetical protein ASUL_03374 [Candidatus Aramenus sulfurataquae]MCL7343716.1 hypothetical protein [Candidatus Aramenus sulfurataquae]
MADEKYEIKSFKDLIEALFKYDNWYLGGFVIALILFVIFDLAVYHP